MPIDALSRFAFFLLLLLAAYSDLRSRRIPNRLTFGGFAAGLVFLAWRRGVWTASVKLSRAAWLVWVRSSCSTSCAPWARATSS